MIKRIMLWIPAGGSIFSMLLFAISNKPIWEPITFDAEGVIRSVILVLLHLVCLLSGLVAEVMAAEARNEGQVEVLIK